jgi:Protein of unknown function (DUF2934)
MAKSVRRKSADAATTAADRAPKARMDAAASITEHDIARRAYDLYLARGCAPGQQLEDWLQAERELRQGSLVSTV